MITYHGLGNNGRLGNQLWQIAGTIALARRHDEEVVIDKDWKYRSCFRFPDDIFGYCVGTHAPMLWETFPAWTADYLGNLEFVTEIEADLRSWLQPSEQISDLLEAYDYRSRTAVHVRREDYLNNQLHLVLDSDWYRPLPDDALFFGLDVAWIRDNFPDAEIVETSDEILDFFIMASCQAHIISNSTFAWWSAWIADGPCIGPRWWYARGHGLDDNSHNMPAHWTLKENFR